MTRVQFVGGPRDGERLVWNAPDAPMTIEFLRLLEPGVGPAAGEGPAAVGKLCYMRLDAWSEDGCRFYAVLGHAGGSLISQADVDAAVAWIVEGPEGAWDRHAFVPAARKLVETRMRGELSRLLADGRVRPDDELGYGYTYDGGTIRLVRIRPGLVRGGEQAAIGVPPIWTTLRDRRPRS